MREFALVVETHRNPILRPSHCRHDDDDGDDGDDDAKALREEGDDGKRDERRFPKPMANSHRRATKDLLLLLLLLDLRYCFSILDRDR